MTRAGALAAAVLAAAATADAQVALDRAPLRPINRALARSVAKALPVPSASGGIAFEFDPRTSAFERSTEVLGQLFLERARPIGRGKLNVSLTYQWVHVDEYEGRDLEALADRRPIRDPPSGTSFVLSRIGIDLVTHMATPSLTWGVTDALEVNLTVPVLYTALDVEGRLRQRESGLVQRGGGGDRTLGVGDVIVRGKYRLLHGRLGDVAAGLVFRLPSGRVEDFQGTGLFEVGPRLYASTRPLALAPHVRVQLFLDAGLDLTPENARRGEGRYGAGADLLLGTRATLSLAFLAREPFARLLPPGLVQVPRAGGGRTPIFGIDPGHPSYYDLSIGGRVNLWRDTVFLLGTVRIPLNDDGVRASVVPLVGVEAAF